MNKEKIIRDLENLIELIKEDKVTSIKSVGLNYYFPELSSPVVQSGRINPECYKQEITFYIGYKH